MDYRKLKIVLLTSGSPFHNAGILSYDIYKSLKNEGHTVLLIARDYNEKFKGEMKSVFSKKESFVRNLGYRVKNRLSVIRKKDPDYCMFSLKEEKNYIATSRILDQIPFNPDLFIYLFPHRFLNSRNLFELNQQTNAPVCIMPIDMAQFTGGCHYANDCEGFKWQCGNCPGIFSKQDNDITYRNLAYKKKYINQTNLFTLTNSWMNNHIRQSSIFRGKPAYRINYVIDEKTFSPGEKSAAKKLFGVPENKKIIFFGATAVHEKRKGFSYLVDAIRLLHQDLNAEERGMVGIAIAGQMSKEIKSLFPIEVFELGHLTFEQLCHAFRMADVFVSPSIQEAGSMMVIQSMMCGTPVVAFEMGNAADFIMNDITGYRAPLYDTRKFEEGIRSILMKTPDEMKTMSVQCRNLAFNKSSYKSFEHDFMNNYHQFIKNGNKNNAKDYIINIQGFSKTI